MRKIALMFIAACGMISAGCCHCGKAPEKDMAVQLYSARDLIGSAELYAQNHEQVLKAIAEMGYTGVEAANFKHGLFYGVTPEQFKADVEAAGMEVVASHTNRKLSAEELASGDLTEALAWWDAAIPAHEAAGMRYVVCPSMTIPETLAGLKVTCDYFNEIGRKCKEAGMSFGFHNHAREFKKVEDVVIMDYMLQNTDPELVFFQMDVYWAVYGNASPAEYFNKYPGRWKVLHIKDKKEIGQSGMVGFDAVFANAEPAGMVEFVVEVEGCRNETALEGLRISADYLLNAPFVAPTYKK